LRDFCAGLSGRLMNGDILAWADSGDIDAVPSQVFRVVRDAGLLADGDPRYPVSMPANADALMSLLWEIDEGTAIELLVSLAGGAARRHVSHSQRRRYPDDPYDLFDEMARLAGSGARWWTNTDLTRWNPVTQHTFDAVVVAAGNGIIVTVIAMDGGS
jgi:hypothetical protein